MVVCVCVYRKKACQEISVAILKVSLVTILTEIFIKMMTIQHWNYS